MIQWFNGHLMCANGHEAGAGRVYPSKIKKGEERIILCEKCYKKVKQSPSPEGVQSMRSPIKEKS